MDVAWNKVEESAYQPDLDTSIAVRKILVCLDRINVPIFSA
jgi:hypothetical protein